MVGNSDTPKPITAVDLARHERDLIAEVRELIAGRRDATVLVEVRGLAIHVMLAQKPRKRIQVEPERSPA